MQTMTFKFMVCMSYCIFYSNTIYNIKTDNYEKYHLYKGAVAMDNYRTQEPYAKHGLYDPRFEHENCGIGAVVNMSGKADHKVVDNALRIVETLEHRAGKDAEGKTGDGVGILLQISHNYFSKAVVKDGISIGGKREYGIGMFFFPPIKNKMPKSNGNI